MDRDLTRRQVLEILNITSWELRQLERDRAFPRIEYNKRVIRYSLPDIMHFREQKRRGGWVAAEA